VLAIALYGAEIMAGGEYFLYLPERKRGKKTSSAGELCLDCPGGGSPVSLSVGSRGLGDKLSSGSIIRAARA